MAKAKAKDLAQELDKKKDQDFLLAYKELSAKYQRDIQPVLSYTPNGITPTLRLIKVQPEPETKE